MHKIILSQTDATLRNFQTWQSSYLDTTELHASSTQAIPLPYTPPSPHNLCLIAV